MGAIAFYGRGAVTSDADIAKFLSPDSCIGALRSRTYSKYVNEKKILALYGRESKASRAIVEHNRKNDAGGT